MHFMEAEAGLDSTPWFAVSGSEVAHVRSVLAKDSSYSHVWLVISYFTIAIARSTRQHLPILFKLNEVLLGWNKEFEPLFPHSLVF